MDQDIAKAIEIIDRKITSLQQARNQLAQAFGIELSPATTATHVASHPTPIPAIISVNGPKSRKESLAEFLKDNGPLSRSQIVARAGLPAGTVSYCLSDKRYFQQLENGDWGVRGVPLNGLDLHPNGVGEITAEWIEPSQQVLP